MKLYTATSLEDIATQFEAKAEDAKKLANATRVVSYKQTLEGEIVAWHMAALILRNTELKA